MMVFCSLDYLMIIQKENKNRQSNNRERVCSPVFANYLMIKRCSAAQQAAERKLNPVEAGESATARALGKLFLPFHLVAGIAPGGRKLFKSISIFYLSIYLSILNYEIR